MSVRTEEIQLRVLIDGSPARRELAQLDQEAAKINAQMRGMKKNTQEYLDMTRRLDQVRQRQSELRKEIGLTGLSMKQLQDELRRLQVLYKNATPNTPEWAEAATRIDAIKDRLRELGSAQARTDAQWREMRKEIRLTDMTMEQLELEARRLQQALRTTVPGTEQFNRLRRELDQVEGAMRRAGSGGNFLQRTWQNLGTQGRALIGALGITSLATGIAQGLRTIANGSIELSDAQANVQRTTNLSRLEVEQLTEQLGQLRTRTARQELLELAATAGKLGITAQEDVLKFVRAGDQINVALGEDLGEDAIKQIGKLNQVFQLGERRGLDLEQQMLRTGSAINTLGMSSTASEAFLVDYTSRMAGVSVQSNVSIEDTLGFAAALDQLGQRSESASTVMNRFMVEAFTDTATYARIAGMEVGEFTALLRRDTNEALIRTLDGLNGNNEGMAAMAERFKDLEVDGVRAVSTLSALAANTKVVREQQDIANGSFAEGTSITQEFNVKNNTLAANLEIIGNRLRNTFVNSGVVNAINKVAQGVADWLSQPVTAQLEEQRVKVNNLVFEILRLNEGDRERVDKIKQLKNEYPQYAAYLDEEKASNQDILKALRGINEEIAKRILLEARKEELADVGKELSDATAFELEKFQRVEGVRSRLLQQMSDRERELFATNYDAFLRDVEKIGISGAGAAVQLQQALRNRFRNIRGEDVRELVLANRDYQAALEERERIQEDYNARMEAIGRAAALIGSGAGAAAGNAGNEFEVVGTKTTDEEREKQRKHLADLAAQLAEFRERMFQATLSADERELRQLDVKHADERSKLRENTLATQADMDQLLAQQGQERADLIAVQGDRRLTARSEAEEKIRRALLTDQERELEDAMAGYDVLIALAKEHGLDTAELERAKLEAIAAMRERHRKDELTKENEFNDKRHQLAIQSLQASTALVQGLNALGEGFFQETQDRTFRETAFAKVTALLQIKIAAAIAVANAIKEASKTPWPGNIPAIATGVGAVLAAIGQAYALLNSTPDLQAGDQQGGSATINSVPLGDSGGILDGPSHARGGLKVWDPLGGRVVAELEGGEPYMVLSKAFRQKNPGLVPRLLRASARGEALGATGGLFQPLPRFNFTRADQAMRVVHMATGGLIGRGTALVNATDTGGGDNTAILAALHQLVAQQAAMRNDLAAFPRQLDARVSLKNLTTRATEFEQLQDLNTARRAS